MRFLACRKIRSTKFRTRLLIKQHARAAESSTHFFVSWKSCLGVSQQAKFLQFWRRPRCRAVLDSRQQRWKRFDAGWTNARFAGGSTRNIVCDSVCPPSRETVGGTVSIGCCWGRRCGRKIASCSTEFCPLMKSKARIRNSSETLSNLWSGFFRARVNSATRAHSPVGNAICAKHSMFFSKRRRRRNAN